MQSAPTANPKTQRQRIYNLLKSHPGGWVASYLLSEIALQYNARLFELRAAGALISNRREYHGEKVLSWYRLEQPRPVRKVEDAEPSPLFPQLTGVHRDNN
jgi:hypothetical protein